MQLLGSKVICVAIGVVCIIGWAVNSVLLSVTINNHRFETKRDADRQTKVNFRLLVTNLVFSLLASFAGIVLIFGILKSLPALIKVYKGVNYAILLLLAINFIGYLTSSPGGQEILSIVLYFLGTCFCLALVHQQTRSNEKDEHNVANEIVIEPESSSRA